MVPLGFVDGTALIHCGVYILAWRGEVVYVGQSKKLSARINTHVYSRGKHRQQRLDGRIVKGVVFDQVWFRACAAHELDDLELELIQRYKPRYNIKGKEPPVPLSEFPIPVLSTMAAATPRPSVYRRF
jgi:excinuclease UvrABC nuclease subunit